MKDIDYCLSSFMAFRYVYDNEKDFGIHRQVYHPVANGDKTLVGDCDETDMAIRNVFHQVRHEKLGLMISGGMDSSILASYMPAGTDAYTFKFLGGDFQRDELERAHKFAEINQLNLHEVEIDWRCVEESLPEVMRHKGAPVHSIEPQIFYAAQQAKKDGVTMMVIGDGADYVFGGMDGLLSRDWSFDEYVRRSIYIDPREVLKRPVDITHVYEPYRLGPSSIDYLRFYDELLTWESYASYENAFESAGLAFIDPYDHLRLSRPLDIERIRRGDTKYIIRDLFRKKYPGVPLPEKLPMPRPVDVYFANWEGPKREEFRNDIDMSRLSGNQKWLLWVAEQFLNSLAG